MSIIKLNMNYCVGCGACEQICPHGCIKMEYNNEGYLYPKVDKKNCTNCGLCNKVCQIENKVSDNNYNEPIETYGGYNNNKDIINSSSSGGIFTALSDLFLKEDIVYGALFNEDMKVVHTMADNEFIRDKFRSSKYVQSEIGECYRAVKSQLNAGKKVLFTGTPCQIYGLKLFLKKEYDKLYTMDIICHGVPSPKLFKDYISYLERKCSSKVKSFNFREKRNSLSRNVFVTFFNKKNYFRRSSNDFFYSMISKNYLRECCYNCEFSKIKRVSDITLGDFWGVEKQYPDLNSEGGISLILINTEKGKKLMEEIKDTVNLFPSDLSKSLQHNLIKPTARPSERDYFFLKYNEKGINYLIREHNIKVLPKRVALLLLGKNSENIMKKIKKTVKRFR